MSIHAVNSMPSYRATFRYGGSRPQYAMLDLEAPDLRVALREFADQVEDEVAASAELVEVRLQADPDRRAYTPE